MPRPNNRFYDLLEVPPSAERRGLEAAWSRVSDRLRRNPSPEAARRLAEVEYAWSVLSDPTKRKLYDLYGEKAFEPDFRLPHPPATPSAPAASPGPGPAAAPWGPPPVAPSTWSAPPAEPPAPPRPPPPTGPVEVWLPFKLAALGGRQEVLVGDELLEVPISPATSNGQIVNYRGRQFRLRVEESEVFTRRNLDIHLTLILEEAEAREGCEKVVPTLDGHQRITVPPGVQDGEALTLEGYGVETDDALGDQVIDLVVRPAEGLPDGRVPLRATRRPTVTGQQGPLRPPRPSGRPEGPRVAPPVRQAGLVRARTDEEP